MADVKVRNHPALVRDEAGFIKNVDKEAYLNYVSNRQKRLDNEKNMIDMQNRIATLEKLVKALTTPTPTAPPVAVPPKPPAAPVAVPAPVVDKK
jgi:hypothetical protein